MNTGLRRFTGILLILIALAGFALGGFGITQIWRWRSPVTQTVQSNISLAEEMLTTSEDLLILVEESITAANNEVDILLTSLTNLNRMVIDADPMLGSLQVLTGKSLPETLKTTRASLDTAQSSADIIDNLLRAVSAIPFFPGEPYNPKVPLSTSLKEISTSLDSMTPSLGNIDASLATMQDNLSTVSTDIIWITANTREVQKNLAKAKDYIQNYREQVNLAKTRLTSFRLETPKWINRLAWYLILGIIWISLAQISLLVTGVNLLQGK